MYSVNFNIEICMHTQNICRLDIETNVRKGLSIKSCQEPHGMVTVIPVRSHELYVIMRHMPW